MYEDIRNVKRPELKNHTRMSRSDRAAQFGAFRALAGHEEAVEETARFTEVMSQISENKIEKINKKLQRIQDTDEANPFVSITWFETDKKKAGGIYKTVSGRIKKIDLFEKKIIMLNGTEIPCEQIFEIESDRIGDF